MTKQRKQKTHTDSIQGETNAFAALKLEIQPPKHMPLRDDAGEFYNAIIKSRDPSMWNDVDLARAVHLANIQAQIVDEERYLLEEGSVVINERGTPIQNPRHRIVQDISRLEISLSKALQTDAASTQGRSRDVAKQNKSTNDKRKKAEKASGSNLIAGLQRIK